MQILKHFLCTVNFHVHRVQRRYNIVQCGKEIGDIELREYFEQPVENITTVNILFPSF